MKRISLVLLALVSSLAFADGHKGLDWDTALSGDHRSESNRGRDQYRHPRGTLEFFGLSAEMTVLEVSPGGGWYTEVLAPLLKDHGQLVAGHGAPNGSAYGRRSLGGYLQKLGRAHDVYSAVDVRVMQPPAMPLDVEAGSVDMAVVFRNVHSWLRAGTAEASLADIHRALKSGGTLGIVQHRGTDGMTVEQMKRTAYVPDQRSSRWRKPQVSCSMGKAKSMRTLKIPRTIRAAFGHCRLALVLVMTIAQSTRRSVRAIV